MIALTCQRSIRIAGECPRVNKRAVVRHCKKLRVSFPRILRANGFEKIRKLWFWRLTDWFLPILYEFAYAVWGWSPSWSACRRSRTQRASPLCGSSGAGSDLRPMQREAKKLVSSLGCCFGLEKKLISTLIQAEHSRSANIEHKPRWAMNQIRRNFYFSGERLTWEKDWLQPFIEQANGFNLSWTRPCFCSDENWVKLWSHWSLNKKQMLC